jgi:6-pyruvoyl-tetrahydropterin synthase
MQPDSGTIFLEDLDRIDVTVFDPSEGVVGQSWHVDLHVTGPLDENGFVHDFSPLKSEVKKALKGTVDHALVVASNSDDVMIRDEGQSTYVALTDRSRPTETFTWEYRAPRAAVLQVGGEKVTKESIEAAIEARIRESMPVSLTNIHVKVRDEDLAQTQACFSYTHGITGHQGLCQRLLHGHRSQIKVSVDGERRADLEHKIVQEVLGPQVHIGAKWQVKSGTVEPYVRAQQPSPISLAYKASLGEYEATIPSDRLLIIDGETSIENLTRFLARFIKKDHPNQSIEVSCYEGIGKGSVVTL